MPLPISLPQLTLTQPLSHLSLLSHILIWILSESCVAATGGQGAMEAQDGVEAGSIFHRLPCQLLRVGACRLQGKVLGLTKLGGPMHLVLHIKDDKIPTMQH
jgi:hypothetical protein